MRFHHTGIAVEDIAKGAAWWTSFAGYRQESAIIHDPVQKVRVQFFVRDDGHRIELVEPAADDSPVRRFLGSEAGGLYHLCYEVDDLDAKMAELRAAGAFPLGKPQPAVAFDGRAIVFMMTPGRQILELVQAATAEP